MQRIFLVRHGEVSNPDEHGYVRSRTGMPLTDAGRVHMRRVGDALREVPFTYAYSSPLPRCADSLQLILGERDVPVEIREDLQEVDMGQADGCTLAEVFTMLRPQVENRTLTSRELPPDVTFPGGESMYDVQRRALEALNAIFAAGHECVLVMTHSGVLRTVLCGILEMPLEGYTRIDQDYGCINLIHVDAGRPIVKMLNFSVGDPLKGAAPFNQWNDYQQRDQA